MSTQPGDKCAARQYSDQMHCAACRLTWDTNDTDPPPCPRLVKSPVLVTSERIKSGSPEHMRIEAQRLEMDSRGLQWKDEQRFVSGCFRTER